MLSSLVKTFNLPSLDVGWRIGLDYIIVEFNHPGGLKKDWCLMARYIASGKTVFSKVERQFLSRCVNDMFALDDRNTFIEQTNCKNNTTLYNGS